MKDTSIGTLFLALPSFAYEGYGMFDALSNGDNERNARIFSNRAKAEAYCDDMNASTESDQVEWLVEEVECD